jgi:hypothetical protein
MKNRTEGKATRVHSGGRKLVRGAMQIEAARGHKENVGHKEKFRKGAFISNDPEGGRMDGPLLPANQDPTPALGRRTETREDNLA